MDKIEDFVAKMQSGEMYEEHAIDWEQRRYEIAKDVLAGLCSDSNIYESNGDNKLVCSAISLADKLIEELKKV